jgi:hypothetical protein
MFMPSI